MAQAPSKKKPSKYDGPVYRDLLERVASAVVRLRREKGLSQEQAAELCEMSTRQLQEAESGTTNVTLGTLSRLATGLDVDPEVLLAQLAD